MPLASAGLAQHFPAEANEARGGMQLVAKLPPQLTTLEDGTFVAETQRYRATFSTKAACLAVPHTSGEEDPLQMTLRLTGYTRGGVRVTTTQDHVPTRSDRRVTYNRNGVTEIYEVQGAGFEQSFRFDTAPSGHGDLVLHIDARGDLESEARGARHQALEFCRDGVPAIRYGEAVAFGRGGERIPVATSYDGRGQISLTVPGAYVDKASYPLTVDPVVGPTFLPSGTLYNDSAPDVSHDPDNGQYMIVWQRTFGPTSVQIRGRIFDDTGAAVSPTLYITSSGRNERPAVVWVPDANGYVVGWETGHRITGMLRDENTGAALSGAGVISLAPTGAHDQRVDLALVSGHGVIAVWDRTDPGQNEPNRIMSRVNSWTGTVSLELEIETIPAGSGILRAPKLTQLGERDLSTSQATWTNRVVWERFWQIPAPGDTDIHQAVVSVDFLFAPSVWINQPPTVVPGASEIGVDEVTPSIARVGDRSLVAWCENGDVLAAIFPSRVMTPVVSTFSVTATTDIESMPAVAGGACEFTVAYGQSGVNAPNSFNIRAARVMPSGSVPIAHRLVDLANGPPQGGLQIASAMTPQTNQNEINTSLLVWWRETNPSGVNSRDVRARFFEPVAPSVSPFGSACSGPGGSLPQIGTANGQPIPGNDTFRVTIDNGPPNSIAFLLISDNLTTASIPGAPGCNLYVGFPLVNAMPAVILGNGTGSNFVPIPCSVPQGTTLAFQWIVYVPGWNPIEFVASDDLDVSWSHL